MGLVADCPRCSARMTGPLEYFKEWKYPFGYAFWCTQCKCSLAKHFGFDGSYLEVWEDSRSK